MTTARRILGAAGAQTVDSPEEAAAIVAWPYRGQHITSAFYLAPCRECGDRVLLQAANREAYADKPIVCLGCVLKAKEGAG